MAQPTSRGPPLGAPIPAHDMSYSSNGSYKQYGANPGPGWSSREIKQIIYLLPSGLNFLIGLTPASFPFIFTIQIYHNIMTVELTYDKNRVEMVCWDSSPGFRMKGAGESTGLWALKNLKID